MATKKSKWLDEITALRKRAADDKRRRLGHYAQMQAFYDGNHFIRYDEDQQDIVKLPRRYDSDPQMVTNFCGHFIDLLYSELTKKRPVFTVTAPKLEGRSENIASSVMTDWLQSLFFTENWEGECRQTEFRSLLLADAAVGVFWNPDGGDSVLNVETGEKTRLGKPGVRAIHPSQIYFPPGHVGDNISQCRWLMIEFVRDVTDIEAEFGVKVEVDDELIQAASGVWKVRVDGQEPYGNNEPENRHNSAVLIEYWERPSEEHPEGRFSICTRNKSIYEGRLPYKFTRGKMGLPFAWLRYKEHDRSVYGKSAMDPIWQANYFYNYIASEKYEFAYKSSQLLLVAPTGSDIDPDVLNDPDRQILEYYEDSAPPFWSQMPTLSPEVNKTLEDLYATSQELSGVNDLLSGENPEGVRNTSHYYAMEEMNRQKHAPYNLRRARMYSTIGNMILALIHERVPYESGLKQIGDHGALGWKLFKDNYGKADFNVEVDEGSLLPRSPLLKQQEVMTMFEQGLFGDPSLPETQQKALEAMEFKQPAEIQRRIKTHKNIADGENYTMLAIAEGRIGNNEMPIPDDLDDHKIHAEMHSDFYIDNRDNEMLRGLILYHLGQTQDMMMAMQQPISPDEIMARNGAVPMGMEQQMAPELPGPVIPQPNIPINEPLAQAPMPQGEPMPMSEPPIEEMGI